ncbi:hypothetical protein NIES4071_12060 [Calothrix sp. NIES-4071]|nr:hypothetical protein NIES4071_12060 [Calothrix sp. NIES-4071]BAZ55546.1 hypothetical protein NIES4105_12020 [Calothrix sp. NIES-4105]
MNLLGQLKKKFKRAIIKSVSIDTAYNNLSKHNVVLPETIATPEALQMVFMGEAKLLQAETHSTPLAYTVILEDVFYCPEYSIILTKDRKIISDSQNVNKPIEDFKLDCLFTSNVEDISGYSVIWHQTTNNYYHTLIENLPRFYLTSLHNVIPNNDNHIKLLHSRKIFDMEKFYLSKFISPNIEIYPVSNQASRGTQIFRLEKLILSKFLNHCSSGFIPSKYRNQIFDKFLPQRPRARNKRIFISRKQAYNGRHIRNESEIIELLYRYGFEVYQMEKIPPEQQIELFYDAEAVVASHGAGLTNILFSENIKVLEFFPYPFVIPHYYYLAKSMGHRYYYLCSDCQYNATLGWNNDFTVDIKQLQKILERF